MQDVVGYEEKHAETLAQIESGYPRFVSHRFNQQLTEIIATELGLDERHLWLTCSESMAGLLQKQIGATAESVVRGSIHGVSLPKNPEINKTAKTFLQNVGGFLSSREAEDELAARGICVPAEETLATDDDAARAAIREVLVDAHAGSTTDDILLAPSGMNAFHAAWRTSADLQATRGRTVWIQLGWLYLDTIAQLRRFTASPSDYINLTDVTDMDAIRAAIHEAGDRLAGLVTEVPTNPLVQTADIETLAEWVHAAGGHMVLDPTLVSPFNIRILDHADVVVNSLTKYAANEGDVLAGSVVINPEGADAVHLREEISRRLDPIYSRDLRRLAAQIPAYKATVRRTNDTAREVVNYLENHPAVREVFWSLQASTRANFAKIARESGNIGSMISFTVNRPLAEVYDDMPLPKGPSFGMANTLICPFIYLAHYDLIQTEAGRAELSAAGIDPELLRLSVGIEPAEEIIAALAVALDGE
ncbi:MAG: aminotransferase class I/II-fold pyridoxal phosphate-dependent enzyme [Synoicihabitans sp.]